MQAFHNSRSIKTKYLNRVKAHEKADEIVKGHYWQNGKGCAVGCTIHSSVHATYETELGIPRILARLEDRIFENIPNELAKTWPRRFLESIKIGANLSKVWPQFAVWLLRDETYGILQFAKTDSQRDAINSVADLYVFQLEGVIVDAQDFREAQNAAYAAADAYAADYAAANAADAAADAAAYAAANATDAAAYAAANAADAAAAAKRTEWRIAQSEKLLELLKAAR